jgi:hypothetical protein
MLIVLVSRMSGWAKKVGPALTVIELRLKEGPNDTLVRVNDPLALVVVFWRTLSTVAVKTMLSAMAEPTAMTVNTVASNNFFVIV